MDGFSTVASDGHGSSPLNLPSRCLDSQFQSLSIPYFQNMTAPKQILSE